MYNITNPLHYIAANKPQETAQIIQNFGLEPPITEQELYEAVDYASSIYGEQFVATMNTIHPDKEIIIESAMPQFQGIDSDFKVRISLLTPAQLNSEIDALNAKLSAGVLLSEYERMEILEKINFMREMLKAKTAGNGVAPSADQSEAHKVNKMNQNLLLLLSVIALMYFGSKIFKN